jgi:acetylornithine deacetylase
VIDAAALARNAAELVRVPSVTGDERAVLERLGELATGHGLDAELHVHDLDALRAQPGHPGEEAPRSELCGLTVTLPGTRPGRVCLNGHLDVVGIGTEEWSDDPWSGRLDGGRLHGRGSVDMKGGVTAALHALLALRGGPEPAPTVVLQAVASEEDGGIGTFAALERDAAFDACLIPEPTGFDVVCAHAGALTFRATLRGRAAHAAMRLEGRSAIDRYVAAHLAMQEHERALNRDVAHPAMQKLALPFPLSVGRIEGGEWSSSVPDRVVFEGRLGVPVGASLPDARSAFEAVLDDGEAPPPEIAWTGGQYAPAETDPAHPWVGSVLAAVRAERGSARVAGMPYGADMRFFCARGIPTVMVGTHGIEVAHAVDEWVSVDELAATARIIVRAVRELPA